MGSYALSGAADADIAIILGTSVAKWGIDRAEDYVLALIAAFEQLAAFPGMGRGAGDGRAGHLRHEHGRHVIYYRRSGDGILIVRVLHDRMNAAGHLP